MILLDDEILEEARGKWGKDAQIEMALEEMGELIVVLQQAKRGRTDLRDITTEIADVGLMTQQLRYIFGQKEVDMDTYFKIDRLKKRLKK